MTTFSVESMPVFSIVGVGLSYPPCLALVQYTLMHLPALRLNSEMVSSSCYDSPGAGEPSASKLELVLLFTAHPSPGLNQCCRPADDYGESEGTKGTVWPN